MNAYGVSLADDAIRFERLLPGPIERIWAYLTESEKRSQWLAAGPMDLKQDGEIELNFRNAELSSREGVADDRAPEHYSDYENSGQMFGRVLLCEPPHRLRFTWTEHPGSADEDDSVVDIVLAEEGDSVRLVLTHHRLQPHELLSVAAGWHTHLDILEDHCNARPPRPFWRSHTALEVEYFERFEIED
jgi:uncharacterized protein YndB with AHSA1/START domain